MKLLDEKGLTTVWAAIKNTFTSKSDADGKYAEKSKALGNINFNYTAYGLNMSTYNVDGDGYGYINITPATSKIAGVMTASDKAKLDGIASGANNYTLPTASASALGGIKVNASIDAFNWPVVVDKNGFAYTKLIGLGGNEKGGIEWIELEDSIENTTVYSTDNILVGNNPLNFPSKSGTLALTRDIPDVSNLCKFNFINSISECKSNRINFLFRCHDDLINLDPFDAYASGTILIISVTGNSVPVKHNSGSWFYEGDEVNAGYTTYIYKENLKLITIYEGKVHYYSL
jgi:hypothetical protein|nr:MAG TPA: Head fiber protein [Bacteriophage sp.]